MGFETFDEHTLRSTVVAFAAADTTVMKSLVVAGGVGTRVDRLLAYSDVATAQWMSLAVNHSGVDYKIAEFEVPATAGIGAVPIYDVFAAIFGTGSPFVRIQVGDTLKAAMNVTLGAPDHIRLYYDGGDF